MNNLSILPFYTSIEKQNHRRSYAYGAIYPLIAHSRYFMPFQVMLPGAVTLGSVTAALYTAKGGYIEAIASRLISCGLTATSFGSYTIVSFPGSTSYNMGLPIGEHYISINGKFSEVFNVVSGSGSYLQLVWRNEQDVVLENGRVLYSNNFANRLLLDTQLGKPEYKFSEEGEERDGYFFPEKQISEKVYRFTFLAPEYLLDVLRLVRMSDHVSVVDKFGDVYTCDTILLSPKWQVQGDLASVEVEFETDTVVKRLGTGSSAEVVVGDFNIDYNEDYYI